MSLERAIAKLSAIMAALTDTERRLAYHYFKERWGDGMALTDAERHRRRTRRRGGGVHDNVHETVAAEHTETGHDVHETVDGSVQDPPKTPRSLSKPEVVAFPGFVLFWKQYPKRVGKGEAEKSWRKSNCESNTKTILDALQKQREFLSRDGGKFVPNPATWLNQKRWEDEPPAASMFSEKTRGNEDMMRRFIERGRDDKE